MSTINHTTPIVGGIIAIFVLSIIGIIFRIMAIRRMRAAAFANRNIFQAPLRQSVPVQPPRNFPPPNNFTNRQQNWNTNNWNQPPPPYPQPIFQPSTPPIPPSPRLNTPRTIPRNVNPPSPPVPVVVPPIFPVPQPSPPNPTPRPPPPPVEPTPPPPPPPSNPTPPDSMNLVDRMREVQTLMLQIHTLENEPSSQDNRTKIQELQRRVTDLSDVESQQAPAPVAPAQEDGSASRREPPPYALDGRDD